MIKNGKLLFYLIFFILVSCGDNSPFDEDYWDDGRPISEQEDGTNPNTGRFNAQLAPLTALSSAVGTAQIELLSEDEVTMTVTMDQVPVTLNPGQTIVTTLTCQQVTVNSPGSVPTSVGTKNFTSSMSGGREILGPQSVTLEDRSLVLYANVIDHNIPPVTNVLFPIACGPIDREIIDDDPPTTATNGTAGTTGGTPGGVVGGVTGGVVGGVTGGVVGGTTGGFVGGATGGVAGGTTGGFVGGGVAGGVGGSVGGTTGGFTTGGTF